MGIRSIRRFIEPLFDANRLTEKPDFNDPAKLGSGKEMVDRLTALIAIFEDKSLDFSKNRADGDDILGDAYEYLMRNFATESGKVLRTVTCYRPIRLRQEELIPCPQRSVIPVL